MGGGGLLCDDAPSQLTDVWIASNVAPTGGGALVQYAHTQMVNVVVADNEERGLDLRTTGASPALSNMSIVGNRATQPGSAVYAYGTDPMLTNVDVSGNTALGGGAIHAVASAPLLGHCNVFDNAPADFSGMANPLGTDGNISVDPQYLDTAALDPFAWDLHLDPASYLVDAGDGNLQDPDGSTADIGALGGEMADQWDLDGDGSPGWWQPGPYDAALYPAQGWDCDDLDSTVGPDSGC